MIWVTQIESQTYDTWIDFKYIYMYIYIVNPGIIKGLYSMFPDCLTHIGGVREQIYAIVFFNIYFPFIQIE